MKTQSSGYYDFRDAKNLHVHQLAGGIEILSRRVDARINGYGPIADTTNRSKCTFTGFGGNSANFKRRVTGALPVIDGEIGMALNDRCATWAWYTALGSYYLFEKKVGGKALGRALGGKGRLEVNVISRFVMRADLTYDRIYKWSVSGTVGLSIPLGKERKNPPCSARNQLPERAEIISIQSKSDKKSAPANIIFVDNRSNSLGTFESPYPTLALAEANSKEGDIIYVFFGDGSPYDSSLTLKDNQRIESSAFEVDAGNGLMIPPQTPGQMPTLTGAGSAVTLANGNAIRGIHFANSGIHAVFCSSLSGCATLMDNFFEGNASDGVHIDSLDGGELRITRNQFDGQMRDVHVIATTGISSAIVNDNVASNYVIEHFLICPSSGVANVFCSRNSTFSGGGSALNVIPSGGTTNVIFRENQVNGTQDPQSDAIKVSPLPGTSIVNCLVEGNIVQNTAGAGIDFIADTNGANMTLTVTVRNNVSQLNGFHGFQIIGGNGGANLSATACVENNQFISNVKNGWLISGDGGGDLQDVVVDGRNNLCTGNGQQGFFFQSRDQLCATLAGNESLGNTGTDFEMFTQIGGNASLVSPDGTEEGLLNLNTFGTTDISETNVFYVTACSELP